MSISFKIMIGAVTTFVGIVALVYTLPIVAGMLSTKGPVYKEADVPQHPARLMSYIPIEIAGAGALIVGVSFLAVGLNASIISPVTTDSDIAQSKVSPADTPDKSKANATEAA